MTRPDGALDYTFIPYPVELADWERREARPATALRILALRRFADPLTGEWRTTTAAIAAAIRRGRSTTQKALRMMEHERFLHVAYVRRKTVETVVSFGGFPRPRYRAAGKPALHWDQGFDRSVQAPGEQTTRAHTSAPDRAMPAATISSRQLFECLSFVPLQRGIAIQVLLQERRRDGDDDRKWAKVAQYRFRWQPGRLARWRPIRVTLHSPRDERVAGTAPKLPAPSRTAFVRTTPGAFSSDHACERWRVGPTRAGGAG